MSGWGEEYVSQEAVGSGEGSWGDSQNWGEVKQNQVGQSYNEDDWGNLKGGNKQQGNKQNFRQNSNFSNNQNQFSTNNFNGRNSQNRGYQSRDQQKGRGQNNFNQRYKNSDSSFKQDNSNQNSWNNKSAGFDYKNSSSKQSFNTNQSNSDWGQQNKYFNNNNNNRFQENRRNQNNSDNDWDMNLGNKFKSANNNSNFNSNKFFDNKGGRNFGGGRSKGRGRGGGNFQNRKEDADWIAKKLAQATQDPWAYEKQVQYQMERIYKHNFSGDNYNPRQANYEAYDGKSQEVNVQRYDEDYIPLQSFNDDRIPLQIQENLQECKYFSTFPIQKHAIPICLRGKDVIACAQTGSGKTAAYFLPILIQMYNNRQAPNESLANKMDSTYVTTLVICPTRELCTQIHDEVRKYSHMLGYKPVVAYGGLPMYCIRELVQNGADFLIATPGRLKHTVLDRMFLLDKVQNLVLDEADRMFDAGFRLELGEVLSHVPGPEKRQTFMFSATFREDVQLLAQKYLKKDYVFISIGQQGSASDQINQRFEYLHAASQDQLISTKEEILIDLLQETVMEDSNQDNLNPEKKEPVFKYKKVMVFAESKTTVSNLETLIMKDNIRLATSIRGDKKQQERELALESFITGRVTVICATDVAARGLDIPQVDLVYNFDIPKDLQDYVHRIGRTGRVGNEGLSFSILSERDIRIAPDLVKLLQKSNQEVPEFLVQLAQVREQQLQQDINFRSKGNDKFQSKQPRQQDYYESQWNDEPVTNAQDQNGQSSRAQFNNNNRPMQQSNWQNQGDTPPNKWSQGQDNFQLAGQGNQSQDWGGQDNGGSWQQNKTQQEKASFSINTDSNLWGDSGDDYPGQQVQAWGTENNSDIQYNETEISLRG